MKLFTFYYYDAPLLKAFLSHYCQFKVINEILIQNQNWSEEDSKFLNETVASYIDEYHKKIVILPSQFQREKGKRGQFIKHGLPKIVSRVLQFMSGETCIWGAMDEILYCNSYEETRKELERIDAYLSEHSFRACYTRHYCVYPEGFYGCGDIPIRKWKSTDWRCRIFISKHPLAHRGSGMHDNSVETQINGAWKRIVPVNGIMTKQIEKQPNGLTSILKLLHYHTLFRTDLETTKWSFPKKADIAHIKQHPKFYINRLPLQ